MKKLTRTLAVVLTVCTLSHAQPSRAAVAIVGGNLPLAIRAVGMLAGSGVVALVSEKVFRGRNDILGDSYGLGILGSAFMAAVGLVVLDGEGEQSISFGTLDSKIAKKIGITAHEQEIYNSEIDMANYVLDQVDSDLSKFQKPSAKDAKKIWEQYENLLAPETVKVMGKISVNLQK